MRTSPSITARRVEPEAMAEDTEFSERINEAEEWGTPYFGPKR